MSASPNLAQLVIMLLASTLGNLSDHLADDHLDEAAELVRDLGRQCDRFLEEVR